MMSERLSPESAKAQLANWVRDRSRVPEQPVTNTTPLIDGGHLDSVDILDLIFLIEDLTAIEIDATTLQPEWFANINAIFEHFFE